MSFLNLVLIGCLAAASALATVLFLECRKWRLRHEERENEDGSPFAGSDPECLETTDPKESVERPGRKSRERLRELEIENERLKEQNRKHELVRSSHLNMLKELEHAKKEALSASHVKGEFLANMSHELRTPINGVIGLTGLLQETDLSEEQKDYVETIRTSADSLFHLINDILDISKIEAGKMNIDKEDFELMSVMDDVVEIVMTGAAQKRLELYSFIDKDIPRFMHGDAARIRQILLNLVNNAIKFTNRGRIQIKAVLDSIQNESRRIRFEVIDTGIGIPKDKIRMLFKTFSQIDTSDTRLYQGTGLGLAISRQLVELMGGKIGVESEAHSGSTFWFSIPFSLADSGGSEGVQLPESIRSSEIKIVSDESCAREILGDQLKAWGCSKVASIPRDEFDGQYDFWFEPARDTPIILLLDHAGFEERPVPREFSARAASSPRPAKILPLIPFGNQQAIVDWRQRGARNYLLKPVRLHPFIQALSAEAPAAYSATALSEARAIPTAGPDAAFPGPGKAGSVLVAEDNPVNRKFMQKLLEKNGCSANCVQNGEEAVKAFFEHPYDLVLMDCNMPVMNGYEAVKAIRARESAAYRVPIVAVTANALKGDREKCLSAGMDDYVAKPVKSAALNQIINRWLNAPRTEPGLAKAACEEAVAASSSGDSELELIDMSVVRELESLGGPDTSGFMREMYEEFFANTEENLSMLGEGIQSRDPEQVRSVAHALKGSSLNYGAKKAADCFYQMECLGKDNTFDTDAAEALLKTCARDLQEFRRRIGELYG